MRHLPAHSLPEDFRLTDTTLEFMAKEYPAIDVERTLTIFKDKAEALGWMYSSWQASFRNYVRNSAKYGGVAYIEGRAQDPRWQPILSLAKPYGFRAPQEHETPSSYRTAFEAWKSAQDRSTVLPFAEGFAKRFGRS